MPSFPSKCAAALATLVASASALNGIVAPANITADTSFDVTFENGNGDHYRVYLAAALAGVNGPTCYLLNSTTLSSPLTNLSIPASVGPSASYYSIAIADLTTHQGATYSNRFTLLAATGNYSSYEDNLHGSPFWSADDLPCSAYECARECAMKFYPADLTEKKAYGEMKDCILGCDGVTVAASQTRPALAASSTSSSSSSSSSSTSGGSDGGASSTSSADAASTSESAANRHVLYAGAAAAGVGALAFLL